MLKIIFALSLLVCVSNFCLAQEGNGIGNAGANSKSDSSVQRLQVLSKPTVAYTELAKKNEVAGTVRLKVKFKKDGTIGKKIKVVQGLPYGLTEQAIAAAREIKFVPEKRNGKVVTVTKTLEYNFVLY